MSRALRALAREPPDVHDIVAAAVEQARPLLQARHHELLLTDGPGPVTVHGDRKRLVQVLANLLNNAAKYTPPWGRIAVHVTLQVLLVDDSTDAAATLALILEAAGHAVTVEQTAQAALAQAGKQTLDACLLDIGLPDINGNELARRLRILPGMRQALLVAVTGYGQPHDREHSDQAGFDQHFVKPVDSARLVNCWPDAHWPTERRIACSTQNRCILIK